MDIHVNSIFFEGIHVIFLMIPLTLMHIMEKSKPVKKRYYLLVITVVSFIYYVVASFILHEWHETIQPSLRTFLWFAAFFLLITPPKNSDRS